MIFVFQITADPSDINVLPEYNNDPRVIGNLVDGVNRTRDDMHLWLTPYTEGQDHFITLTFDKVVSVALIRFWVSDLVCQMDVLVLNSSIN